MIIILIPCCETKRRHFALKSKIESDGVSSINNGAFSKFFTLFSLEMASVQLITRLISSETGLSSEKLRTGKLEPHEWTMLSTKVKNLEKAPLFIDDTPSL